MTPSKKKLVSKSPALTELNLMLFILKKVSTTWWEPKEQLPLMGSVLAKSNTQYAFWELLPFWLFCCLVRPLLVCYIDSNFDKWKITFYSLIKSYSFQFFSFILQEVLLIRSAGRERRRCFWTDVSLFFFWNCVTRNCWMCFSYLSF